MKNENPTCYNISSIIYIPIPRIEDANRDVIWQQNGSFFSHCVLSVLLYIGSIIYALLYAACMRRMHAIRLTCNIQFSQHLNRIGRVAAVTAVVAVAVVFIFFLLHQHCKYLYFLLSLLNVCRRFTRKTLFIQYFYQFNIVYVIHEISNYVFATFVAAPAKGGRKRTSNGN